MLKKALILAAGLGTRLRPITETVPKAMAPIVGKPILDYTLALCKRSGLEQCVINTHYFPDTVTSYFGDAYEEMTLQYSFEEELLENAGALKNNEDFFHDEDSILVIASDNLAWIDLPAMVDFHRSKKSLATIATVTADDVSRYGIAQVASDGRILTFQEKPTKEEALGDQVATCIYLFSNKIFHYIPHGKPVHFGKTVFPMLLQQQERVFAYRHDGYWNDVGNAQSYLQANLDVLDGKMPSPFTVAVTGERSFVDASVVCEGKCSIKDSVIFPGVTLKDATIEKSVLVDRSSVLASSLQHVVIGADSVVDHATLKDVAVWPSTVIKGL